MAAVVHDVLARNDQTGFANLDDFALGPGLPTDPRRVVTEATWSLYGLDLARDVAVFVDLPEGTDLARSPFVYATQHELAQRVLTLSLTEMEEVADLMPPLGPVIFVFSIGRCGSTLLSHALNAVPGVWGLSEPDAYSTLILQHFDSPTRQTFAPDQVVRLIRASTRLQYRPPQGRQGAGLAVKFRSQSLFQADLYHAAFPDAAFVFLYRDAVGWAQSVYGMMRQYGFADILTGDDRLLPWTIFTAAEDRARLDSMVDIGAAEVPAEVPLAPAWAQNMAEYTRQLKGGVPFLALRYNEFNRDREASLVQLLQHCHLPVGAAADALATFETDSQAGTKLARDLNIFRLTEARLDRLRELLARDPIFGNPDLRLADIYTAAAL